MDAAFDPLKVYDAQGKRMDEHNARIDSSDARDLLVDLKKLPEGSYRVEWRVTSIDGHVIEDAYAFNVSANASETQGGAQAQAEYAEGPGANRRPEKSRDLLAGGEHGRVRSNSAIRSPTRIARPRRAGADCGKGAASAQVSRDTMTAAMYSRSVSTL